MRAGRFALAASPRATTRSLPGRRATPSRVSTPFRWAKTGSLSCSQCPSAGPSAAASCARTGAEQRDVFVTALDGRQMGPGSFDDFGAQTSDDGFFYLENLEAGASYVVQVMGQTGLGPRVSGVVPPAEGLEIEVTGVGRIEGHAVDESGAPLREFDVNAEYDSRTGGRFLMRAFGRGQESRVASEDGSFILDELPVGPLLHRRSGKRLQRGAHRWDRRGGEPNDRRCRDSAESRQRDPRKRCGRRRQARDRRVDLRNRVGPKASLRSGRDADGAQRHRRCV